MTFKVIRGQGQVEEMTSVPYRDYFWSTCFTFCMLAGDGHRCSLCVFCLALYDRTICFEYGVSLRSVSAGEADSSCERAGRPTAEGDTAW